MKGWDMVGVPAIFRGLGRMRRDDDPWNDPLPEEDDGAWGIDILVSLEAEDDGPGPIPPGKELLEDLVEALTDLLRRRSLEDDDDTPSGGSR